MKRLNRTKKCLSVVLSVILCASVMACSKQDDQNTNPPQSNILMTQDLSWRNKAGTNVYKEERQNMFFFSDKNDAVTYFANSMYESYGYLNPANQPYVGIGAGWVPAWYEWLTIARNWSDNGWAKDTWRQYIIDVPMTADGYIWSYDSPHWPDMGHAGGHNNYHYDNNFRYINAVWQYVFWENSLAILDEVDNTDKPIKTETYVGAGLSEGEYHAAEDASKGLTVGQKLEKAMNYVLNNLEGANGLIVIDEDDNDGLNVGTVGSYSCNYWDNIPFGYKSAYENILFYNALKNMSELETKRGNAQKAAEYTTLAATVKTNYNKTFWNEKTGRYSATVDKNGVVRDYGVTFVNTEAVAAGLADESQMKSIYDWLDGKRIVAGDTSTGADIYKYIAAPVSNTLDYAAISENGKYWWHDNGGSQALSGNGTYGYHVENGGAILYTEYYDIMGRIEMGDLVSAYGRMETLAKEYAKDELNRDPMNPVSGGFDVLGFVGEFPESGLVPVAYLYGFLGVNMMSYGMHISPNIPEGYEYMGVNRMVYGGTSYSLTVKKDGGMEISAENALNIRIDLDDTKNAGTRTLFLYDKLNNLVSREKIVAQNGVFSLDLTSNDSAVYAILK